MFDTAGERTQRELNSVLDPGHLIYSVSHMFRDARHTHDQSYTPLPCATLPDIIYDTLTWRARMYVCEDVFVCSGS